MFIVLDKDSELGLDELMHETAIQKHIAKIVSLLNIFLQFHINILQFCINIKFMFFSPTISNIPMSLGCMELVL